MLRELAMIARGTVMVCAVLLLAGGLNAAGDKKEDKDKLQGEWTVVSMDLSGMKLEGDDLKKLQPLTIKGNDWTAPSGGKFTIKLDPAKNPKQIDLQMEKGGQTSTWPGIYKIEGDTFTFCRSQGPDGERPKEFKSGDGVALLVFKRAGK
jgi:uncharacterized protein (TIGR03067 family)